MTFSVSSLQFPTQYERILSSLAYPGQYKDFIWEGLEKQSTYILSQGYKGPSRQWFSSLHSTVALSSGDSTQYICHLLQFNLKIHKETICLNCQVLHKSVIFVLILIISQVTSFYGYHIQDFNLAIKVSQKDIQLNVRKSNSIFFSLYVKSQVDLNSGDH